MKKTTPCTPECKPRWVTGKGSFKGWELKLCSRHQIIHKMRLPATPVNFTPAQLAACSITRRGQ